MLKKILVTGGSGFIGSNLIKYLLKKIYKVIIVDKLSYSSTPDKFKKFTRNKNYKFIKVDLLNEVLSSRIDLLKDDLESLNEEFSSYKRTSQRDAMIMNK